MKNLKQLPIVDSLLFFSVILLLVLHYTRGYEITNVAYFFLAYLVFNYLNKEVFYRREYHFYKFLKRYKLQDSWDYYIRNTK